MEQLLIEFKPVVLQFLDVIIRVFGIAFATLGIVYIFGRMLEILKNDRPKNVLAIFVIYILQLLYEIFGLEIYKKTNYEILIKVLIEKGWDIFFYGSITVVIYVTFCWRLYTRVDSFLDKKVGEDKSLEEEKKDNKKRKK